MSINKSLKNAMLTNGGLLPYSDNTMRIMPNKWAR